MLRQGVLPIPTISLSTNRFSKAKLWREFPETAWAKDVSSGSFDARSSRKRDSRLLRKTVRRDCRYPLTETLPTEEPGIALIRSRTQLAVSGLPITGSTDHQISISVISG